MMDYYDPSAGELAWSHSQDNRRRIAELINRINALEKRVADLEYRLSTEVSQ